MGMPDIYSIDPPEEVAPELKRRAVLAIARARETELLRSVAEVREFLGMVDLLEMAEEMHAELKARVKTGGVR